MKKRFFKIIRLIFFLTILVSLVSLTLAVVKDPRFRFLHLQIVNNQVIDPDQLQLACTPISQQNIVWLCFSGRVKTHLLDLFPELEDIQVRFGLPSTLILHLKEKPAVVQFVTSTEQIEASQDGTILKRSPILPPVTVSGNETPTPNTPQLPKIEGISSHFFSTKRINPILGEKAHFILKELNKTMPKETFTLSFKHLYLTSSLKEDELILIKDPHIVIKMGTLPQFSSKCKLLSAFLQDPESQTSRILKYIDLRIPDKLIASYEP